MGIVCYKIPITHWAYDIHYNYSVTLVLLSLC